MQFCLPYNRGVFDASEPPLPRFVKVILGVIAGILLLLTAASVTLSLQ